MRTKAEALAKPMHMDKWEKRGKHGFVINSRIVTGIATAKLMQVEDYRVGGRYRMTIDVEAFRRWAANAEYLGGAE